MGTNYYMCHPDRDVVDRAAGEDCFIESMIINGSEEYTIHVCKKSYGWKPLFQAHRGLYLSVKDLLRLLECSPDRWKIADEYGYEISYQEFARMTDDWQELQDVRGHDTGDWSPDGMFTDEEGFEFVFTEFS